MNHFIAGIIKIILLEGSLALLLIDRMAEGKWEQHRKWAARVLAFFMVLAWCNFGGLRGNFGIVHHWEQFHFVIGAKYQKEVGWFDLYKAAIIADRESAHVLDGMQHTRDITNFQVITVDQALIDAPRVRAKFSDARWAEFKDDWRKAIAIAIGAQRIEHLAERYKNEVGWLDLNKALILADGETTRLLDGIKDPSSITTFAVVPLAQAIADAPRIRSQFSDARWAEFLRDWRHIAASSGGWDRILMDHGNSNSPAWALIAHPIAQLLPLTSASQVVIGLIDMLLMAIMWVFIFRTFGERPAITGLIIWAALPIVFDYLAGSFLRWDWIFCLGMALCFMKKEKWATAGAFFGFAVATKLFPLYFGVCLLFRAIFVIRREKAIPVRYKRFFTGTAAAGIAAGLLSSAMFGGLWAWQEYKQRIDVARDEKFYSIQYSLQTVYLQFNNSSAGELASTGVLFPSRIKQELAEVDIKQQSAGFFVLKLLFTFLVVLLLLRADDIQAFAMGPLLVFIWLIVNMYYWNMLGLMALGLALRKDRPPLGALLGLHAILIFYYVYQHLNRGFSEGYAVAVLLCFWIATFALFEWREIKGKVAELMGFKPAVVTPPARAR